MKNQKNRSMKVYSQNGRNYKATPTIILKGQWLEEMGFAIGDYISVSCENGKLVITLDTERAELEQMKADFMGKETKKLAADLLIGKILHSVAQQISGYSLYNIFYEFRTVGFYAFPFLGGTDALVGDGFTAESVFTNLWLHIAEYSAGRELD